MILGLTGGTGCGKTTALEAIAELGGLVLDCDKIYHRLLQEDPALLSAIHTRSPAPWKEVFFSEKNWENWYFPTKTLWKI